MVQGEVATAPAADTPEQAKIRVQLAADMGEAFTAAQFKYPEGEDIYLNPRYWAPIASRVCEQSVCVDFPKGFRLKEGVSAADAIEDAFQDQAIVECEIALQLVFARGILKVIGRKAFDRAFGGEGDHRSDLAVGFGDGVPPSRLKTLFQARILKDRSELLPGDMVYFHNAADYKKQPNPGPWRGENTVLVVRDINGQPRYSGHGDRVERVTEEDLDRTLFKEYNRAGGFGRAHKATREDWNAQAGPGGKPVGIDLSVGRPRIDRIQALKSLGEE